jgi:hypothetical protein
MSITSRTSGTSKLERAADVRMTGLLKAEPPQQRFRQTCR